MPPRELSDRHNRSGPISFIFARYAWRRRTVTTYQQACMNLRLRQIQSTHNIRRFCMHTSRMTARISDQMTLHRFESTSRRSNHCFRVHGCVLVAGSSARAQVHCANSLTLTSMCYCCQGALVLKLHTKLRFLIAEAPSRGKGR